VSGIVIAQCAFGSNHQQLIFGCGDLLNELGRIGGAHAYAMQVQFDPASQDFCPRLF
jgi:hypothetical protein